ncbi:Cu,Zn superoxide dismutase-like protein [Eremomyces bilateralis CBS 781.70]|uniref:superoxide dismutase n=1 Tax=Eremomyces bilateralis CBS 781.70 TaxID=1392243 RepID=A0A6G1FXD3_9PEZI|nr:Cu,Zn superoxide dismutase-like protein [Eremomyces bilateralis CBS 781.70]KAF1810340.1 Cu,Zn superoxide dismutase-like protein [Eremomyces bilateralis CBS 781.70]
MAAVAFGQTTGKLGDAAETTDNPLGAVYVASFSPKGSSKVSGSIVASSGPDGEGVHFSVSVSGLPADSGPFGFHLHAAPVPADGGCNATLAHLDPYIRGADTPCDKTKPETCEVGDLSGKHGALSGESYSASFIDKYASLKPGIGAFFGNRSVVIHLADKSRLACTNWKPLSDACDVAPGPSGPKPNSTAPPDTSIPIYTPPPVVNSSTPPRTSSLPSRTSSPPVFTGAAVPNAVNDGVWVVGSALMAALTFFL